MDNTDPAAVFQLAAAAAAELLAERGTTRLAHATVTFGAEPATGRADAVATIVRAGRTIIVTETIVRDEAGAVLGSVVATHEVAGAS